MSGQRRQNWNTHMEARIAKEAAARETAMETARINAQTDRANAAAWVMGVQEGYIAAIAKEAAARDKQLTNLRELVFGWHMNDANLNELRYKDTQAKIQRLYWSMCAFAAVVIVGEIYQAVTR